MIWNSSLSDQSLREPDYRKTLLASRTSSCCDGLCSSGLLQRTPFLVSLIILMP